MPVSLEWPEITALLGGPGAVLQRAFGWGTPAFDANRLVRAIDDLAQSVNIPAFLDAIPIPEAEALEGRALPPGAPAPPCLDIPVVEQMFAGIPARAGVRIRPLPAVGGALPGLALVPYGDARFNRTSPLDDTMTLEIRTTLDLGNGVGIVLRPNQGVVTIGGLSTGAPAPVSGMLTARIEYASPDRRPIVLIGVVDGPRVQLRSVSGALGLYVDERNRADLYVEAELNEARLIVPPVTDGFLGKILPNAGIDVRFDLAVGMSTLRGVYFRGSGALEITVPTHLTLGPIELDSVSLGIRPKATGELPVDIGASFRTALGPLTATVQNMGLTAELKFPGQGGNLGPVDARLGFKWPDGIGLELDAGGFKGGGFLEFKPDEGRYAGILHLEFQGIVSVTAIGLIDTRLPDGREGFALLLLLTAEFSPPFQLSWGFTLIGVGGLLGLNRTAVVEVLQRGVRDGGLDSILFPRDPLQNARRIISDMQQAFPPREGQFVFGPMFKLGWGTPTLVSLSVGLIIEIPDPVRIALLGVLRVAIPEEHLPLIQLQVNFLGALDLEKEMLSFDASLYDSRIVLYPLTGDMALRAVWGASANFLLTVGGFHPAYTPPPLGLPPLRRLGFMLADGLIPRIRCECYFALTSNTVQQGALLEIIYGIDDYSVHGHLGYDVLIQFNPFHLTARVSGSLAVTLFGEDICGVWVEVTLDGPAPWEAHGRGRFKVLIVKFTVQIDLRIGEAQPAPVRTVDVLDRVIKAIELPDNWRAELPPYAGMRVRTRELPATVADVVVHPFGALVVSQKAAPFDVAIDRIGTELADKGPVTLHITKVSTPAGELGRSDAKEQFAPGQYQTLSDAERLSRRSFEPMNSGARMDGAGLFDARYMAQRNVEYERHLIDRNGLRQRLSPLLMSTLHFSALLEGSATALCAASPRVDEKPRGAKVGVRDEAYTVVWADDLTRAHAAASRPSQTEAIDHAAALIRRQPELAGRLRVVPSYEVAA